MTERILTVGEAVNLATIIGWAQGNLRLSWLDDRGDVAEGTARSIGDEQGNFLNGTDDVRDGFLRITTASGFEWFVPMADVLDRVQQGTMVQSS